MKITKMTLSKSALAAMFLMMSFAYSINVQAGVCEAEHNEILQAYTNNGGSVDGRKYWLEVYAKALDSGYFREYTDDDLKQYITSQEKFISEARAYRTEYESVRRMNSFKIVEAEYNICMTKAQRDGTLKSTNQANNKSKSSTGTQTSQSANANSQDASNQDTSNNDTSSNTKPLTKAELKAQKAEQQAQQDEQQAQQSTQVAQDHQTKANQKRQGKRRRHEPENEAHNCIKPDFGGLYGGMENTCNFKVWYTYCGYHPTENSWLRGMACEKQSFGTGLVSPGRQDAAHTHGVEKVYWFACKDPAWPVDVEFDGDIKGRCHTVGGGSD